MGIQDLQRFIEAHVPNACVSVDLLKIARGVTLRQPRTPSSRLRPPPAVELCLVVDAEGCLDRLYGGYFSDWVCGGQWSRMVQFLSVMMQTVQSNNMELAVYFGGALELSRMTDWVSEQYSRRVDINQTLKHLAGKGTPPPKVWWTEPVGLRTTLRLVLRHLKVQVLQSMDDHRQEVIAFCRDNNYHGVMAEDAEYVIFNPPRYFSAKQMKLTYKGSLETKEYILNEMARGLDLQPNRFCLLAALLGNYLLPDEDLVTFYKWLAEQAGKNKPSADDSIQLVVQFVRSLPSVDNLDDVGARVFKSAADPRIQKLKASVQYFVNGTQDGYLKYKPELAVGGKSSHAIASDGDASAASAQLSNNSLAPGSGAMKLPNAAVGETAVGGLSDQLAQLNVDDGNARGSAPGSYNGGPRTSSPVNGHMDLRVEGPRVVLEPPPLPSVATEVMRTASERHQKGLMSPWVYQILSQGELKIAVSLEEEVARDLPNAALFYRPIRERVYAILFNIHHHSFLHNQDKDKPAAERHHIPQFQIREWVYSRNNPYARPDMVSAKALNWGVPTVQRLWFGNADDEKKRRLRAFLTCMESDTPFIRNSVYVPQHLLILACVLRYMMTQNQNANSSSGGNHTSFLCKPELDALIAQALSAKLADPHYLQELQLRSVTPRGVQLASLFMQGVEHALFANDACGAPVPWPMCCPWLFFDGKLFHSYLLKATQCRNVLELCDDQMDMVSQLDLIRQAVLEGLQVQYARPRLAQGLTPTAGGGVGRGAHHPGPLLPSMGPVGGRGGPGARMVQRGGGRLEIGGVVVGSWAGNNGGRMMPGGGRGCGGMMPGGGRGGGMMPGGGRGGGGMMAGGGRGGGMMAGGGRGGGGMMMGRGRGGEPTSLMMPAGMHHLPQQRRHMVHQRSSGVPSLNSLIGGHYGAASRAYKKPQFNKKKPSSSVSSSNGCAVDSASPTVSMGRGMTVDARTVSPDGVGSVARVDNNGTTTANAGDDYSYWSD